jgi:triacylglycerol lipase
VPTIPTRPRPVPDLNLVFHPQQDAAYVHFEGSAAHPFDPAPGPIGRRNAWWLAEAALLSYWNADEVNARYDAAGLESEPVFGGTTQCYLAWNTSAVLVSFRGTEPGEPGDTLDDVTFALTSWDHPGTHVHAGFKTALTRVWPHLEERLRTLAASRTVWFAGHSLGAALATLAADRYPLTAGVCTLGSPRVGDVAFSAAHTSRFGRRSLRVVNDADIVTHVPPPLPYRHTGTGLYIDPDGHASSEHPALRHFFRTLFGNPRHVKEIMSGLHAGTLHEAPDFLLDHMPRAYTWSLWNAYAEHGN